MGHSFSNEKEEYNIIEKQNQKLIYKLKTISYRFQDQKVR